MPPEFDKGMDEAIDRFWDQVAQNRSNPAGNLDPVDMAAIRHLHAHDDRPEPTPAFTRHLREELMHAHAIQVSSAPGAFPLPNGRVNRPWRIGPPESPTRRQWALAQVATAALVLLTLAGAFVAFGPARPSPEAQQPAIIPALIATSATPEVTAGQVAEFLWQTPGSPNLPFGDPAHPAIDAEGTLWVPDAKHDRFLLYAPDGTFLEAWGASGSGDGEFAFSCDNTDYGAVAFDAAGNIFVLDSGNRRIQKFGPDRDFLASWGSQGTEDDQFLCTVSLAVDDQGRVYVVDELWGKVKVFGNDGSWLATWGDLNFPQGIAVDGDGNVWVVDAGDGGAIVKFSPDGETLATWADDPAANRELQGPDGIAVDAEGRVFVASFNGDRIQVFSPEGEMLAEWGGRGNDEGQFLNPSGIILDGQGGIYVTEHSGLRVQKFRLLPPLA